MAMILVFLVVAALFANSTAVEPICDPEHQFSCGTSCIPIEFRCDNIVDCPSAHDEVDCNYLHTCPVNEFMCRSGECIPREQKCNGIHDCSDATDEAGCMEVESAGASWMIVLWILLGTVIAFIVLMCYLFNRYPNLRHRVELIVGTSVPLISSPASKSAKFSPVIKAASGPVLSKTFSADDITGSFHNPAYNQITSPLPQRNPGQGSTMITPSFY